jgi:hypothetical protein
MVEDLDQALVGLLALRHLLDAGTPPRGPLELGSGGHRHVKESRWARLSAALLRARERLGRLPAKLNGQRSQPGRLEVP